MQKQYKDTTKKMCCSKCNSLAHVIENNIYYCATCMLQIQQKRDGCETKKIHKEKK